jgi:hypothetical protein
MKVIDKIAWIEIKNKTFFLPGLTAKTSIIFRVVSGPWSIRRTGFVQGNKRRTECTPPSAQHAIDWHFPGTGAWHPEGVIVKMTCYSAAYTGTLKATAGIEELVWLQYSDKDKIAPVDIPIFDFLNAKNLL